MEQIEVFSPARVDLAGGTLDIYPVYLFFDNPFTLNATLSKGVKVTIRKTKGKTLLKNLNAGVTKYFPSSHKDLSLVSFLLDYLEAGYGFEVEFYSDFPQGSSLGVSSSLLVAIFYGFKKILNLKFNRKQVADILKNIEAKFMKYPAGLQDYLAPLYGGANAFYFGINGFERKKVNLDKSLRDSLIFVFTGKSHFSGSPNWELFKGFFDKDKKILEGFGQVYQNSKKIMQPIEKKDIKMFGKLLKEDFTIRKNMLDSLIPEIGLFDMLDGISGVYGYRLCGAASGGTVVVCVNEEKKNFIVEKIKEKGYKVFDCNIEYRKVNVNYA